MRVSSPYTSYAMSLCLHIRIGDRWLFQMDKASLWMDVRIVQF